MSFKEFSQAVHAQYASMTTGELYVVDINPDDLWAAYLAAFPEGTDPIFRVNTEHTCSCCKNFIRNIGNVVSVVDGKIQTVWDVGLLHGPYPFVADALAKLVSSRPINGLFRKSERSYGAEQTIERKADEPVLFWNHFHGGISDKHFTKEVGAITGDYAIGVQMFERACAELTDDAFITVRELMEAKALYKGDEFKGSVRSLHILYNKYHTLPLGERNTFAWTAAADKVTRLRNSAIGTLLVDLSEGMDVENAVKAYERVTAPENYKRPTALVTPRMVEEAMKVINAEGLEPALERRQAVLADVSVNDVLWVDNGVAAQMRGGLHNMLLSAATTTRQASAQARDISIGDFLDSVMPHAKSIDLLVQNKHQNNFVALTAPVHADAPNLFKWGNPFAWSYDGNVTDSIKERVKAAGGNVSAPLRFSLAWSNYDDLDIYVTTPSGERLFYGNRGRLIDGGKLDVDMNAGGRRQSRSPVENVTFAKPRDGRYQVHVNNYIRVETSDPGFTIEVENNGGISQYSSAKSPASKDTVHALTAIVKNGAIVELTPGAGMTGGGVQQEKWGVKTETFVKVQTIMHSPNYWGDNAVGHRHTIFMVEGCKAPEAVRGVYNEYLVSDLEKHRRVFELVGNRTKCPMTDEQLSGLGFSSTRSDVVTVRVDGGKQYNINF